MESKSSIYGKVAVITGASSGIGRGVAVELARQGCKLTLCGRSLPGLMLTKGLCCAQSLPLHSILHVQADMTKPDDIQSIVQKTMEKFNRLDILFHNAGTAFLSRSLSDDLPMDQYLNTWTVNVDSIVLLTKFALPYLEKTKGSIVIDSSVCGKTVPVGFWSYNMTKAAVDQLCRSLAVDLAPIGIRVNNVNPACVITNFHMGVLGIPAEYYDYFLEKCSQIHALDRVSDVSEVAKVVSFLVSDKAEKTTGECVSVDGGAKNMFLRTDQL